jgi:hypothetical protein
MRRVKGLLVAVVGSIGAAFIYGLIRLFGRVCRPADVGWLVGPLGGTTIGERVYEETAAGEALTLIRHAREGGLIPSFDVLARAGFDPARVHPKIRDFYQRTHAFRLDTWATTYFPARLALWALVTTISRRVEQLNFPIDGLETSHGMTSEIALMRDAAGALRYTGWLRKLQKSGNVIYSGFYMTVKPPLVDGACVKVVFPMPNGNATVVLRPDHDGASGLRLESVGRAFGDAGFYRVQREREALRVWRVSTLHERFRLYLDGEETVRCEHEVSFLGLRVLTLHYRIAAA